MMSFRARYAATVVFAATMAMFEAAVVVYLRHLWDLGAIDVAAISLTNRIVVTELGREAASLVMILTVAVLAGRRGAERVGWAAVIFGIWDVLYYGFLRLLSDWPTSVLDWDVLFLIPRPWIGPVLAPLLVSSALIAGGSVIVHREAAGRPLRPRAAEWLAGVCGGAIVVGSFVTVGVPAARTGSAEGFSWPVFFVGLAIALTGLVSAARPRERSAAPAGRYAGTGESGLRR